jgi:hypothetical protein
MKRQHNSIVICLAAFFSTAVLAQSVSPEADVSDEISYSSLEEAMKDLHSKPTVSFRKEGGWIVAYDSVALVSWLLTPKGHPAYPSILKRHIVNGASGSEMATEVRCFASQATCDKYFGGT